MNQQNSQSSQRSGTITIRTQYQTINYVTMFVAIPVAGFVAFRTNGMNFFLALVLNCVSALIAMLLSRLLIMRFGVGTFLIPKGPYIEDIANRTDNEILLEEFVRLGGKSARLAASKLPDNIGNVTEILTAEPEDVLASIRSYFKDNGVLLKNDSQPQNETIKGVLGCGIKQLNPALVTVNLQLDQNHLQVNICAVAKEGLVKQRAGEEAATILSDYLRTEFAASQQSD